MEFFVLQNSVLIAMSIREVFANSTNTEDTSILQNGGVKAAITCGILAVLFIVSLVVAKLFDVILDRQSIDDSASDVSDHTRDLIRARLSVIQFKRKEMSKSAGQKTLAFFRRWAEKTKNRTKQRQDLIESNRPATADKHSVLKVEQMRPSAYPSKLPSFLTGTKQTPFALRTPGALATMTIKTPSPSPSPSPSLSPRRATPAPSESPKTSSNKSFPSGYADDTKSVNRPISSRTRDTKTPMTVNVTSTHMPSTPRVGPKSVHFEDEVKRGNKLRPLSSRPIKTPTPVSFSNPVKKT